MKSIKLKKTINFILKIFYFPVNLLLLQSFKKSKLSLIELKKNPRTSVYFFFLTFITYLIIGFTIYKIVLIRSFKELTFNLEPFSICLGFFGILISWIIFVYIKQEKEIKDEAADMKLEELKDVSLRMFEFIKYSKALLPVKGLRNRLANMHIIYKHASRKPNGLYIMTSSFNYGNILTHRFKSLHDSQSFNRKVAEPVSFLELYEHEMLPFTEKIEELQKLLLHDSHLSSTAKMIVLDEYHFDGMIDKVIKNDNVIAFSSDDEEPFSPAELENKYLFKTGDRLETKKCSEELKKQLREYNNENYKRLLEKPKIKINRVGHIPFQFIASVPDDKNYNEGKCIVLFSNINSTADSDTTTCFYSENYNLIRHLMDVFYNTLALDIGFKEKNKDIMEVFGFTDLKEVVFVMHETKIADTPEGKQIAVHFSDDIYTQNKFKELFRTTTKESEELFKKDRSDQEYIIKHNAHDKIITIGLFRNKITDMIANDLTIDRLFVLELVKESNGNSSKDSLRSIKVKSGQHEDQWMIYTSKYGKDKTSPDYGIFVKMLYKENTIVICGGCDSYGTHRMGNYIFEHWEEIVADKENPEVGTNYKNSQFVSVYEIPVKNGDIKLLHHYQ